jgi:hypothetical protein
MAEYHPEVWEVLRGSFGDVLTRPEQDLLSVFRVLTQDGEIEIDLELTEALASLFVLASQRTPRADPASEFCSISINSSSPIVVTPSAGLCGWMQN